jgi:hypothetical protein
MCKLLVSTRWAALVSLTFAAFVLSASGDEKPPASSQQPSAARPAGNAGQAFTDESIMQGLDELAQMDFVETPLKDVVQAIAINHKGIPIVLDTKAITDAGGSGDTPITFSMRGIPLRSALRLMLHEHELDFVLSGGVLTITAAESPTTLRQYEVADLLSSSTSIAELSEAVRFALPRMTSDAANASAGALDPSAPSVGRAGSAGPPAARGFSRPARSTGPAVDGDVVPFQSVLLVRATDRGHANVETFLAELRHHMINHAAAEKAPGEK